jgi:hypothetical protein
VAGPEEVDEELRDLFQAVAPQKAPRSL